MYLERFKAELRTGAGLVCEDNLEIVLAGLLGDAFGGKCALESLRSITRSKNRLLCQKTPEGVDVILSVSTHGESTTIGESSEDTGVSYCLLPAVGNWNEAAYA